MSLKSFGAELRHAREEKRITLMDISAATRINVKFLEAMEEGIFATLPQTYIRAFLREYAQTVGLSIDEVLAKYDAVSGVKAERPAEVRSEPSEHQPLSPLSMIRKVEQPPIQRHAIMIGGGILAVLLSIYVIYSGSDSDARQVVREVPFDTVVRESEATLTKPEVIAGTAIPIQKPEPDSLKLEVFTKDSVWMSLVIDGHKTEEYLFAPNGRKSWVAKEQYSITLGNAGGAIFRLNGVELAPFGKSGSVVRNVIINEKTLNNKL
ncbi:MAG TPA: RodZ domain-containing protein [Bacteroidota bacterium]|nr:RodZ domain-containing protein [Bacteroidota bacterium]